MAKKIFILFTVCTIVGIVSLLTFSRIVIEQLLAPRQMNVNLPQSNIPWKEITLTANSQPVAGWYFQGAVNKPALLLLHGIGESRLAMYGQAEYFANRNWSVLLIDLPGHGESPASHITLGVKESYAVHASYQFLKKQHSNSKIGVIGFSLGGASVVLGETIAPFDAIVLESVYSNLEQAVTNRMTMRFGTAGIHLAKLMELHVPSVIGISCNDIAPLSTISKISVPVLIVAGEKDQRTHLWESEQLFNRANNPKRLWIVHGMGHEHSYTADSLGYEQNVISFLETSLK